MVARAQFVLSRLACAVWLNGIIRLLWLLKIQQPSQQEPPQGPSLLQEPQSP